MGNKQVIGVVGGVGPYAGLDLVKNIFDQTVASIDQEHLPVVLMSHPSEIEDRTKFLLGTSKQNPANSIVQILQRLAASGCTVAGIPCNTAHAPSIFHVIQEGLKKQQLSLNLLHMIDETATFVKQHFPGLQKLGLLSTTGTAQSEIYQRAFEPRGMEIILPSDEIHVTKVHSSIYDPSYGIKAFSNPVTERARIQLVEAIAWFRKKGIGAVILGCTEIPLAIPEKSLEGTLLINPTAILARALISNTYPEKLKTF